MRIKCRVSNDANNAVPQQPSTPPRRVDSRELFGAGNRVAIAHGDQTYLLQITRQGKLILTK